jgi:hypothetical protein
MLFDVICGAIIVTLSGLVVRRPSLRSLPEFAVLVFAIGFILGVFMLGQYGIERVFRVLSINPDLTQKMLWISTIGFLTDHRDLAGRPRKICKVIQDDVEPNARGRTECGGVGRNVREERSTAMRVRSRPTKGIAFRPKRSARDNVSVLLVPLE